MAWASGPAEQNLISGDFTHQKSGVRYRIYKENGRVWLSFDRSGVSPVSGKRELLFYIGSGRRGRSYLFTTNGFWFESPVNWYADEHVWDMTPAAGDPSGYTLTLRPSPVAAIKEQTMTQSIETIERRINALGLTEPTIQRRGGANDNEILVQLPGEGDPSRAKAVIQAGGQLELKLVEDPTTYPSQVAVKNTCPW